MLLYSGDSLTTSGATIAGAFLGPKAIAKLMTNKAFVQWISEPVKDIAAPQVEVYLKSY